MNCGRLEHSVVMCLYTLSWASSDLCCGREDLKMNFWLDSAQLHGCNETSAQSGTTGREVLCISEAP